ncbi:MAG: 30S ribosomal protein S15 [Candidatus Brennerbacteria bacterium CG11_big_fil_rev_8_21_14_0_20_43_10]|uniref:Small ribosomal subunit protein uS15 n=3 Tax=Candidatus Brenneribacteriota TaxID=1817902 RepID=A0A2M8C2K8_9BACT|nr:MAG: 30S ribosomal protein S15 [Parcubacteria group bacterium CG1_02_44_31]PIP50245.1 MAG: 30S ribosomal protein S15 [Candidatus Brennerbacteria bacterium CG23_combo_of_CG06-09_8_20_14_all_44_41]PIR26930.1 MAG: 30S ribosomal protein S15 [Candidatus Brennerbacteria bacterium CG11_big_fil_rev_8_21_14_0_20_43_10]PIX28665.1 MAG: 30S ribosomal protein S15 [Candidatus Brennerbacteria bacterium CG_4_8_14_3_um_filter_43_14]PJA18956.1 MAG: 30S ribosomal protein S15 [Candidatus Brennerbacteria bacteri
MLRKKTKTRVIEKTRIHKTDTGSAEVQISLLNKRIEELSEHLKTNKKDFSSRRGLLQMIIKRKRLTNWLKTNYPKRYQKLVKLVG